VNGDLLTVRVNIAILSLPLSVLTSLFFELGLIFLDVGRAETTVSGKISGLRKNGCVLWVNSATLGGSCGHYDDEDCESVHDEVEGEDD
jgi:hypothetical protein